MKSGFVVFSQDGCSWCEDTKILLRVSEHAFEEINLSEVSQEEKNAFLDQFPTRQRTVPKVYFNGVLIGGSVDLQRFLDNPLTTLLMRELTPDPILIKRLSPTAIVPTRGSTEAIGLDVYANLGIGESIWITPNEIRQIPTGWAMTAPRGHYLRAAPRSGLAIKHGIDTLAGVIDRDYTGEVTIILTNHGHESLLIKHGERVGQVIAEKAALVPVLEVGELNITGRGSNGYGSTGR